MSRVWAVLSQSSVPWPRLRSVCSNFSMTPPICTHTHTPVYPCHDTCKHKHVSLWALSIDFYHFCLLMLNLYTHTQSALPRYAYLICTVLVFLPLNFSVDLMKYHMNIIYTHMSTHFHPYPQAHSSLQIKG